MELPVNEFKRRLAAGETQYGLWLGIPDTVAAEICAGAGMDWLLVDGEHAPFTLESMLRHLQAIAAYGVPALVRPASGDPVLLKQVLDLGAQTLLIPMVESADQAESLVRAVRYPPHGVRGIGTALARAARWGTVSQYLQRANDEICLLLQVETAEGLRNLAEIVSVPGVDGIFIGPSDLSASLGHIGNAAHPDVVAAIVNALETITGAGVGAGILATDPATVERYVASGARFVGVGIDTVCLGNAVRKLVATYGGPG